MQSDLDCLLVSARRDGYEFVLLPPVRVVEHSRMPSTSCTALRQKCCARLPKELTIRQDVRLHLHGEQPKL